MDIYRSHGLDQTRIDADRLLEELDQTSTSKELEAMYAAPIFKGMQHTKTSPVSKSLIVMGSLAFGSMMTALSMSLLWKVPTYFMANIASFNRDSEKASTATLENGSAVPISSPWPTSSRDLPTTIQNDLFQTYKPDSTSSIAWGPESIYKFGRIPDATYPDNCAYSKTDPAGKNVISLGDLDYWACRDEGGNPSEGFSVVWADGKRSTYIFGAGGVGAVVGTNAGTSSMRWRNDNRNGSKVIIISHETGSTSWIPGHVN
jgi:hypothetical protein